MHQGCLRRKGFKGGGLSRHPHLPQRDPRYCRFQQDSKMGSGNGRINLNFLSKISQLFLSYNKFHYMNSVIQIQNRSSKVMSSKIKLWIQVVIQGVQVVVVWCGVNCSGDSTCSWWEETHVWGHHLKFYFLTLKGIMEVTLQETQKEEENIAHNPTTLVPSFSCHFSCHRNVHTTF